MANWIYVQTTNVVGSKSTFAWVVFWGRVRSLKLHQNWLSGFRMWWVKICPFPLYWTLAYKTACCSIQAVIVCYVLFLANVLRYVRYMLSAVRLLSVCLLSVCLSFSFASTIIKHYEYFLRQKFSPKNLVSNNISLMAIFAGNHPQRGR